MSAFPLPITLVSCKLCKGPMQANILPKRDRVSVTNGIARKTRARTYLVICRHCDKAAVAPGWMEGHLDELEAKDNMNAQLRILR